MALQGDVDLVMTARAAVSAGECAETFRCQMLISSDHGPMMKTGNLMNTTRKTNEGHEAP